MLGPGVQGPAGQVSTPQGGGVVHAELKPGWNHVLSEHPH